MCSSFAAVVKRMGWNVYPETSGWDIVILGPYKTQIGVEAKLRPSLQLLRQLVDRTNKRTGPDYVAALVGSYSRDFEVVAKKLRFPVFRAPTILWEAKNTSDDIFLQFQLRQLLLQHSYYRFSFERKLWLPESPIEVPAGVPSPTKVTRWKVKAVALTAVYRQHGFLLAEDFKTQGIAFTKWWRRLFRAKDTITVDRTYSGKTKKVRVTRYAAIEGVKLPDELWPEITNALCNTEG